jgi:hypothetical protein
MSQENVEIWSRADWQMSLGERTALEGLLSQLKPGVSIEIGTATGGSLERIAVHSEEVHSIDLAEEPQRIPANAAFHKGNSRVVLPALLEGFAAQGRSVDFALVDGEHSREGARADLSALLASPTVVRTLILVHDSRNPAVRAGIASTRLADNPKVAGWDLDFVPGRLASHPPFEGQQWGGFALVVVATGQTDGLGLWALRPQAHFYEDSYELVRTSPLRARLRRWRSRGKPPRAGAADGQAQT